MWEICYVSHMFVYLLRFCVCVLFFFCFFFLGGGWSVCVVSVFVRKFDRVNDTSFQWILV